MHNTLTFHLTHKDKDITSAKCITASDELLSLMALSTGSPWRMISADTAQEVIMPFRQVHFWSEVNGVWQAYQANTPLSPVVRAEIEPTPQDQIWDKWSALDLPPNSMAGQVYRYLEKRDHQSRTA